MINGAVSLLVGTYLLMVLWGGQGHSLYKFISQEVGFLKWAGAVITLSILYNAVPDNQGKVIKGVAGVALLALLVGYGDKILSQVNEVFKE